MDHWSISLLCVAIALYIEAGWRNWQVLNLSDRDGHLAAIREGLAAGETDAHAVLLAFMLFWPLFHLYGFLNARVW